MKLKSDMVRDRDHASRKSKWEKVIRFALPELGDETVQDNFASEGQLYTRQVSEALQGWAYGSNIDWVRIAIKNLDEEQKDEREIRTWCQDVETLIKEAFDNSHFYQEALLFTSICFNLSTSIMYIDYDRDAEEFIFKTLDPRQCLIKFNRNQKLRLFMYEERLDHIDAVEQFGNALPKEIKDCTNFKKKWRFTHVVAHVPTFNITGINGDGEWAEFYICEDLKNSIKPLSPRRMQRCPVVIWRFKRNIQSISSWGCGSPGEIGITDLTSINLMQKSDDILIQRIAEPPITATVGLRNINTRPSGITYLNHGEDYAFKQFNANGQQLILNAITLKQERLKEIYYVNFFLIFQQALTSGQRTATEAGLIDDEKTQNMSSFSSNLVVEFLEPVINAVYDILHEHGKLPSPPESIAEKLRRKSYPYTLESIEKNLRDVAGIRVICSFPDDIYTLADKLCSQDDVTLLERKDYIANPKPNGYRSLHLILDIPIFLANETKHMPVEVQFRTIAMDFWASLEHKVKYKKDLGDDSAAISEELRLCAEDISRLDIRMQQIKNKIDRK